jgi:tetratricopeptide (TPR) repeat protein
MFFTSEEVSERYVGALRAIEEVAGAYYYQGRLAEALLLFQNGEPLVHYQEVPEGSRLSFLLSYADFLVDNYFLTNQNEKLMRVIVQRAREEAIESGDEKSIAAAISHTGKMFYYCNLNTGGSDYTEARNSMRQALARYEKLDDTHGIAQSLFFIGLTYERHNEEEQARGFYRQALDIAREYDDKWVISEATRHLAGLNMGKDNDTSLRYALESLRRREELSFKRAQPSAHLLLSSVYIARGELDTAEEHVQKAQELAEAMALRSSLMSVLLTQGEIQQQRGDMDEARASFEKAAALAGELGIAYGIAAARAKLEHSKA